MPQLNVRLEIDALAVRFGAVGRSAAEHHFALPVDHHRHSGIGAVSDTTHNPSLIEVSN